MSRLVTAAELYEAARETCLRLYIANGGNKNSIWTVQPFPGTAAISCEDIWEMIGGKKTLTKHWTLCMPAYPVDARLPRWHSDLLGAYSVHELLHALWTDWSVHKLAARLRVGCLVNALEDVRIEKKAQRSLDKVPEAKRLLEALTVHIVERAIKNGINWNDPSQFAFLLNCVLMQEVCKYRMPVAFPRWRDVVGPMLPLYELALARLPACRSTRDVLTLALDLQRASQSITLPPAPATPPPPVLPTPTPSSAPSMPRDAMFEQDKGEDENEGAPSSASSEDEGEGEGSEGDAEGSEGDNEGSEGDNEGKGSEGDNEGSEGGNEGKGSEGDAEGSEGDAEGSEGGNEGSEGGAEGSEGGNEGEGSEGDAEGSEGGNEGEGSEGDTLASKGGKGPGGHGAPADVSDATQTYSEASLNDLAQEIAQQTGRNAGDVENENRNAEAFFDACPSVERDVRKSLFVDTAQVGAFIETPARLRRHVINAVKSPERVGVERRQSAGRFDMRCAMEARSGALSVYRRKTEEEGREVAVSLLLDGSSSMSNRKITYVPGVGLQATGPSRMQSAACLALHMGDALRIASVPFEVGVFHCGTTKHRRPRACVSFAKQFRDAWNNEARERVATLASAEEGGTYMMLALKTMVARCAKQQNVTRRIVLCLSDGQDAFPAQCVVALRAWAASLGVEVFGIGLQLSDYEKPGFLTSFGEEGVGSVFVDDVQALSETGFKALLDALDKPSRVKRALAS